MSKTLKEASLQEMVAEVQSRYPEHMIELQVVGHYNVGSVPKGAREAYERKVARDSREAGIRLGFLRCRKCRHQLKLQEVCGCLK